MKSNQYLCKVLSAVLVLVLMGNASAQQLEEIVVTATKRAKSAQDIPMSIQVVSSEALVNQNISNLADVSNLVPNLSIGTGLSNTFVNIRGQGSGNDRTFEQSVGLFVDNVYMPRGSHYRTAFLDVDRIEVLRGSQAVLFGLNSTAGAISVHSAKNRPGDEFEGHIRANYETEYEAATIDAALGGSLSESFALRFAGRSTGGDSFYNNGTTGQSVGDHDFNAYRLTAVWDLSDATVVEAKVESLDNERPGIAASIIYDPFTGARPWDYIDHSEGNGPGSYAPTNNIAVHDRPHQAGTRGEFGFWEEATNASLTLEHTFNNDGTLTALVGRSEIESEVTVDLLFTAAADWVSGTGEDYEQTSAEVRYTSPEGEGFNYVAGVYYHSSDLLSGNNNIFDLAAFGVPIGNVGVNSGTTIESDLVSPFLMGTWALSDSVRLTVGARYVSEDKDIVRYAFNETDTGGIINAFLPPITPLPDADTVPYDNDLSSWTAGPDLFRAVIGFAARSDGFTDSRSSDNFMGEVLLEWDASDTTMLYGKAGNSAKSGGWGSGTQATPDQLPYDDEKARTVELGSKSSLAGGAAELNVAAFYTVYEDLQVNSFDTNGDPQISNAAESISRGIELDSRWAVNDWLMLTASLALLDTEYDSYPEGPGTASILASGVPERAPISDYAGLPRQHAPEYSANIGADIFTPIGNSLNFLGGLNLTVSDEYFTDGSLDSIGKQDSWTKVNAYLGIASADETWRVSLVGKNLTDEVTTNSYQFFVTNGLAFLSPPRTLALQAEFNF